MRIVFLLNKIDIKYEKTEISGWYLNINKNPIQILYYFYFYFLI